MANRYEEEFRAYNAIIDGKEEFPQDVSLWQSVRLPLPGKPKFLGTFLSRSHRLYVIVELGMFMGEGKIRIPVGLYGDQHDAVDEAVVSHNRLQLNYQRGEGLDKVIRRLGLPWGGQTEDIRFSSGGGYHIFRTLGYELILHRSLFHEEPNKRILLPKNDDLLHALAAHKLTEHISDVLGHITVKPTTPQELQLGQP